MTGVGNMPGAIAVLSAFPAELAAVLRRTTVDETRTVDGHVFRTGTLAGVQVVVAMTGIGLENAAATTRVVLEHFEVRGIVVSGVAGSPYRIGDVSVPEAWALDDGSLFAVPRPWLARAARLTAGAVTLERCTVVPSSGQNVCLPFAPLVIVGGVGHSSDPYNGQPFQCTPGGVTVLAREVFGCDVAGAAAGSQAAARRRLPQAAAAANDEEPTSVDMETAAIGREAARKNVPFIAFRATSDGSDDPLGLPGFPTQFFAYYRLCAETAAGSASAFIATLAGQRQAE